MEKKDFADSRKAISTAFFICSLVFILFIFSLYSYNIFKWKDYPDLGFGYRTAMGIHVVGIVTENGRRAGIQIGDRILQINGKSFTNIKEARNVVNRELGDKNTYLLERKGQRFQVTIINVPKGLKGSFGASGLPYLVGLCYALIGVLVFIMKSHRKTTWIFFLFSSVLGIFIMFLYRLGIVKPFELENVHILVYTFMPAVFIHLSLNFPQERNFPKKHPFIQILPYLISSVFFLCIRYATPTMTDTPKICFSFLMAYIIGATFTFLGSCLQLWIASSSEINRIRSKVILLGGVLSVSLPLSETLINTIFHVYIVPTFNFYLPFLVIFPLSIAYSIVRHNLFDVDVYIKRAVGYCIMTTIVGLAYFSMQITTKELILQPLFGEYSERIYPILFAIIIVFLFNPINRKVQGAVDKLFFRKKFDYKETVISVSHALTSVLNLTEVIKRIINTVRKEMFIDTAGIILLDSQKKECQTLFIGDETNNVKSNEKECIKYGDPFVDLLSKNKKLITIYDITEDPYYKDIKNTCSERFSRMGVSMVLPLIYQGDVTGALALGYKKSGHFYTREDIDLLDTLASHGAVAIENAKLAEQMKKEETVRTNLARYLSPQIVDQVIKKDVQVNLGGDRKVVTVLFSDIRNFTRISETQRPDQLVQILNEYFTEMAKIIFENQGSLDKYIGDAIVAVFGSLIPLENSAKNAVQAAVQMMNRMPVLNEKWMKEYGFSMDIGIGINTGEVFLGNIGSPERMEFTVIGDTVNVASRFSGLAQPSQILITRETLNSLGNDVNHKELPAAAVKGKTEKLEVYEIPYP